MAELLRGLQSAVHAEVLSSAKKSLTGNHKQKAIAVLWQSVFDSCSNALIAIEKIIFISK